MTRTSLEQHMEQRQSPERDAMLAEATAFFLEHGSHGWYRDRETEEQGRQRAARDSALAELYAKDHGWEIVWEDDWDRDTSHVEEFPDAYDAEPDTCEMATLYDEEGTLLGSLGCIDDASSEYRRVIFAQLADEQIPWLHRPVPNTDHYLDAKRDDEVLTCGTCGHKWCGVCDPTPAARCPREYDHTEDERGASRAYGIGLPVVVTVWDDGTVKYEIDTSEAGAAIFDTPQEDVPEEDVMCDDRERIEDDHFRRGGADATIGHDGRRPVIDGLTACNLTCAEAEELAEFFRRADKPNLAERIIREHGLGDDSDEDDHHDGYDPEHICIEGAS